MIILKGFKMFIDKFSLNDEQVRYCTSMFEGRRFKSRYGLIFI